MSRPTTTEATTAKPLRTGPPDLASQLAAIVEHSNDAIFSRTFAGIITTWNAAAARIFGYSSDEVIGRTSRLLLPHGKRDEFRTLVGRLRRGQIVAHFETERLRKDGSTIHVSLTLSPIRDSSKRLIGFSTTARDITEQTRFRERLTRREQELNDLFEEASIGLVFISTAGGVLRANQAFLAMLQRDRTEVLGKPLQRFHPAPFVLDDLLNRLSKRETVHNYPTEFVTDKGDVCHVLLDADGLWEKGRLVHTRWFVRNISQRRKLERELLINSDREQSRFSHELHDGLGQQLSGVTYLCNVLRETLAERNAPETSAANRIFELLRKAIEDTRRMARGLSPVPEGPDGLTEALRELATQTSELQGIRCRLNCPKPVLASDVAVASHLYRIAQEAVNNAVKHARPTSINISLRQINGRIALIISDNGRGIGLLSPNRKGLGLRIMQYRAGLIGGAIEVIPRHPRGTLVSCTVTLSIGASKSARP